jgi:hypothetical protein
MKVLQLKNNPFNRLKILGILLCAVLFIFAQTVHFFHQIEHSVDVQASCTLCLVGNHIDAAPPSVAFSILSPLINLWFLNTNFSDYSYISLLDIYPAIFPRAPPY